MDSPRCMGEQQRCCDQSGLSAARETVKEINLVTEKNKFLHDHYYLNVWLFKKKIKFS